MMLPFSRSADSHDAWFGHHYADLLRWAIHLTGGDRDAADDLVHDLFVHVMASRPDLEAIDTPKAYFYKSLRNLHLSNARRLARHRETVVGCVDFDVLEYVSLRASLHGLVQGGAATHRREEFQHQLRAVWCYAQRRKSSSKTACVLILRFFHGYYPEEIALVLRSSREAVDELLSQARKEARLFLADADGMADEGGGRATAWPADGLLNPPDLANALHEAALRSDPDGCCLGDDDIATLYPHAQRGPSVPLARLTHVVSCRWCLGRVTRRLDLPPLAERHPLDSLGYDRDRKPPRDSSGGGSGSGAGRGGPSRARQHLGAGHRRLADLLAHTPKELRIAVNGVILGSQQVTSAVSRQTLLLTTTTAADFLEIFSERDVRLLFLNLDAPPHGPVDAQQTIALSDGRQLEARVSFAGSVPVVHVSYLDPTVATAPAATPTPVPPGPRPRPRSLARGLRAWIARLPLPRLRPRPLPWRLSRRGAFTTLAAATVIAAMLVSQLSQPVLSAAEVLHKSNAVEAIWRADVTQVVHRTVDVVARSRETGVTTRRRVEEWQSAARGLTVRRAYDDRHQLLAGEWIDASGKRTLHRPAATTTIEPTVQGVEAWQMALSAGSFLHLVGAVDRAGVTKHADRYHLSFDDAADDARGAAVLLATLIVRDDWHVVEQRASVRTPEGTIDFTWIERSWMTRPTDTVPSTVFDVDASLGGRTAASATPTPISTLTPTSTAAVPPATPRLELAALSALRRIDADLGGEVRVRRANGRLDVTGLVASNERRLQIRSVLAAVARDPAVHVRIETADDEHARARRRAAPTPLDETQPPTFGVQPIPAHDMVRAYLVRSGVAESHADNEVARTANRLIQQAARMRVHAWALRGLLDQFPPAITANLDAGARQEWQALVGEYGRGFLQEATALQDLLAPLLSPGPSAGASTGAGTLVTIAIPPDGDTALRRTSTDFVNAAADIDRRLMSAFTVPQTPTRETSLDAASFWPAFQRTVALASAISRAAARPDATRHP